MLRRNSSAFGDAIINCVLVEEYEELIEDIVRDGRLYSFYRHQQVLKASIITS